MILQAVYSLPLVSPVSLILYSLINPSIINALITGGWSQLRLDMWPVTPWTGRQCISEPTYRHMENMQTPHRQILVRTGIRTRRERVVWADKEENNYQAWSMMKRKVTGSSWTSYLRKCSYLTRENWRSVLKKSGSIYQVRRRLIDSNRKCDCLKRIPIYFIRVKRSNCTDISYYLTPRALSLSICLHFSDVSAAGLNSVVLDLQGFKENRNK